MHVGERHVRPDAYPVRRRRAGGAPCGASAGEGDTAAGAPHQAHASIQTEHTRADAITRYSN